MKLICCFKLLGCLALILLSVAVPLNAAPPNPEMAAADAILESATLDSPQAEKALKMYERMLASASAPRALVLARLARTSFILGDLAPKELREDYYRKGQIYAAMLIHEYPHRTEGHYWLALNLCGQADVGGYMVGRRILPQIIKELERSLALSETYDQAGAHRVLGRIYFEAPAWPMSVGDMRKSLHHLQAAVRLAPDNSTNHLYLAQTLYGLHYRSLAQQQLELVLKCTQYAVKPQDLEENRQEARRLLAEMSALPLH
jgi:tetratricopeptide (TPR) repeat protein